jgi:hypothetical protein
MKIFTNVLVVLAAALIIFNITLLDFKHPFKVTVLLLYWYFCILLCGFDSFDFKTSKKIEEMNNKL